MDAVLQNACSRRRNSALLENSRWRLWALWSRMHAVDVAILHFIREFSVTSMGSVLQNASFDRRVQKHDKYVDPYGFSAQ